VLSAVCDTLGNEDFYRFVVCRKPALFTSITIAQKQRRMIRIIPTWRGRDSENPDIRTKSRDQHTIVHQAYIMTAHMTAREDRTIVQSLMLKKTNLRLTKSIEGWLVAFFHKCFFVFRVLQFNCRYVRYLF